MRNEYGDSHFLKKLKKKKCFFQKMFYSQDKGEKSFLFVLYMEKSR